MPPNLNFILSRSIPRQTQLIKLKQKEIENMNSPTTTKVIEAVIKHLSQ